MDAEIVAIVLDLDNSLPKGIVHSKLKITHLLLMPFAIEALVTFLSFMEVKNSFSIVASVLCLHPAHAVLSK